MDWLNLSAVHLEQRLANELPHAIERLWGTQLPGLDLRELGLAEMKETYYVLKDTLNSLQSITGDLSHTSIVTLSRENYDANQRLLRRIEMEAMPQFVSTDPFFIPASSAQMTADTIERLLDTTFMLAVEGDTGVYQNAIYDTFGIRFTGQEWALAGIHFTRVGAQRIAQAFDVYGHSQQFPISGYEIYRRTFGDMYFDNTSSYSTLGDDDDNSNNAFGKYTGSNKVEIFISRSTNLSAILTPNLIIHELGHAFNAFAALGDRDGNGNINDMSIKENMPEEDRPGMGYPNPDRLLDSNLFIVSRDESWEAPFLLTKVLVEAYNKSSAESWDEFLSQIGSPYNTNRLDILRQSSAFNDPNEITADAFLNWVWYMNTNGEAGFTPDEHGERWVNFFSQYMSLWMRNAVVHNLPLEEQMVLYQEHGFFRDVRNGTNIPAVIRSVAEIQSSGRDYILNINENRTNNLTSRGEIYPVFGLYQNHTTQIMYAVSYVNGKIVLIPDYLFTSQGNNSLPTNLEIFTSPMDILFEFDPTTPFQDTLWAEDLFSSSNQDMANDNI